MHIVGPKPIKLGYLFDFTLPPSLPAHAREDLVLPFELVFRRGHEAGVIDRPVEVVFREVDGLPKGDFKAVADALVELADDGCLAIYGPLVTDNCVPARELIEELRIPSISCAATDDWLGEWTFALPQGSTTDEPIFWADLLVKSGVRQVAALIERNLLGETYIRNFRKACADREIQIVAEEWISQSAHDMRPVLAKLHDAGVSALVHCGLGFGIAWANAAFAELGWDPLRLMGTAFQMAWMNDETWNSMQGWTGIEQHDEENTVARAFLDEYEAACGRRPENSVAICKRDFATALLHAFADAHPLTPQGVKEALERVKMVPAASGGRGTRISFGKWTRRGWMSSSYLVARQLDREFGRSHLVARFDDA